MVTEEKRLSTMRASHPEILLASKHRTHRGKQFDLKSYPYLRQPLDDKAQVMVVEKSTQGGWTEMLIIKAMAKLRCGFNIFWVLPTHDLKGRFVKNRWDRSVAYTEGYRSGLRSEETKVSKFNPSASMSLKHMWRGSVAFVGSNSMVGFGEFPADVAVIDEYNNCAKENLPMAEERLSNSEHRLRWYIGNPTIEGEGISVLYKESNQYTWNIRGECGHWIVPDWYKHVVRRIDKTTYEVVDPEWDGVDGPDARLICDRCGKPVDRHGEGFWEDRNPSSMVHGYQVSKLFSTKMSINEMLIRFDRGIHNPTHAQRFQNADLGRGYSAEGSKILDHQLTEIAEDYAMGPVGEPCFAGVDIGTLVHVVIGSFTRQGTVRVVYAGAIPGIETTAELVKLVRPYRVRVGVIDEQPEKRFSRKMVYRNRNWWMCGYVGGKRDIPDPKARVISTDRTVTLDAVREMISLGPSRVVIPRALTANQDFVDQMTALTRVYNPERNKGEGGFEWKGDNADHYFHAFGYMLLAMRMVMRRGG